MPIAILLVLIPALWLAWNLGSLLQLTLPTLINSLPPETYQTLILWQPTLLWLGPTLVILGLALFMIEIMRHWAGLLFDNLLILIGSIAWLTAAMLGGSVLEWLALPIFALLLTPALTTMVILTLLMKDDTIDGSLMVVVIFLLIGTALHLTLNGVPSWLL